MFRLRRALVLLGILKLSLWVAWAQDLSPRAYVNTPLHSNAITLTYSYFNGSIDFNGLLPVTGAKGVYSVPILTYYHAFALFGHSANFVVALPYGIGKFSGTMGGELVNQYRSGLTDSVYRLSVNLKGGPALAPREFVKWKQKTLIGVSLKMVAPTGQYDPTKLINWGTNRWSFKPEIGVSRRWKKTLLDAYGGAWFYTENDDFWGRNALFPARRTQTRAPVASFEAHLSYDFKPMLWISLDGNFWWGGTTSVNGVKNPQTEQRNSRLGATASFPLKQHQALKVSYSNGTYTLFGGEYQNLSIAWQYSWLGRPK
jgi:hypothetical protein